MPASFLLPMIQSTMNRGGASSHLELTGLGAVSPLGVGVPVFIQALRRGESGVRQINAADPLFRPPDQISMRSCVVADCPMFRAADHIPEPDIERLPRLVPMALAAAREAMRDAKLPIPAEQPDSESESSRNFGASIGLILGTGAGGIDFTLGQAEAVRQGRRPSLWTITNATHGNLAGELSIRLGLRGPSFCVSDGCASSSDALGLAMRMLRANVPGTPDAFVVIGADAHLRWETLVGMEMLKVISIKDVRGMPGEAAAVSRPFDRTRDGFVLGEGAWAVVIERPGASKSRGHAPRGLASGYGATCDAYHRVRPAPDMEECARAIQIAMQEAGVRPEEIGIVQYHGTSTVLNDAMETRAVRMALGDHAARVQGSSIKSMIGHPQGACGLASVVATVGAMRGADGGAPFVPPTINLREPDPACDLDYTPLVARPTHAGLALVNCLAFGAKNSALIVEVPEARGR